MRTTSRNRRSIRLVGYDYTWAGSYFVTICVQGRLCLFGDIEQGNLRLNDAGEMVRQWYEELPSKFPRLKCGNVVGMPNPFHAIIHLGTHDAAPAVSLATVVQWFKTMTSNDYIRGVHAGQWAPFDRRLWQRNYWEHIVRDADDYQRIADYIASNPIRWPNDQLHPEVSRAKQ